MSISALQRPVSLLRDTEIQQERKTLIAAYEQLCDDPYREFPAFLRDYHPDQPVQIILHGIGIEWVDKVHFNVYKTQILPAQPNMSTLFVVVADDYALETYCELPVKHQSEFLNDINYYKNAWLVSSNEYWRDEFKTDLEDAACAAGLKYCTFEKLENLPQNNVSYYKPHTDFYKANFDALLALESQFADKKSILVYYDTLRGFISMNYAHFYAHKDPFDMRYLPDDVGFEYSTEEIYADCGAFDGTDAIRFAAHVHNQFNAIHVFEPGKDSFYQTCQTINHYIADQPIEACHNFYVHQLGVWDSGAFLATEGVDPGLSVVAPDSGIEGNNVFVTRLDYQLEKATYIKLEVEGAENEGLRGASRIIKEYKPKLAVATYHKPDDYLTLTKTLAELDCGYELRLRHYTRDFGLTCFYCV